MSQIAITSVSGGGGATTFVEDTGSAVPAAGILNIVGGEGIATTGSGNTVTITATGAGFKWNNVTTTSQQMAKENGYAANNVGLVTLTLPLPGGSQFGDTVAVMGVGLGGWTIAQGAGQQIIIGASATTAGTMGSLSSTMTTDAIELTCRPDNLTWVPVRAPQGNPTVA